MLVHQHHVIAILKLSSPSDASVSLIRESRHLVLVLPINGLDTCINRLLVNGDSFFSLSINNIYWSVLTNISINRTEGKDLEDDLLYSEILAALAAGTKIIPVTADFQVPYIVENLHRENTHNLHSRNQFSLFSFSLFQQWPSADELPEEIREIAAFNSVRWVHDYQVENFS